MKWRCMIIDYALEVVIVAHGEGETEWLGAGRVVVHNHALEVVILAQSAL